MKKLVLVLAVVFSFIACKEDKKTVVVETSKEMAVNYQSFGKKIIADDAIAAKSMAEHYKGMNVGDSIDSKMIAKVDEVCKAKGCWMKLNLDNGEQVMVKFKDYGFFMPKDIEGREVIVNGRAYVKEVSVDEQRHYAEDGGESAEAIAAITEPKRTFSFEADGVLLKE